MEDYSGEMVVAAAGELHLEIVLQDLRSIVGAEIVISDPVVSYRETVTAASSKVCLAKSPNRHNRMYMTAEVLSNGLAEAIELRQFDVSGEANLRAKTLVEDFGWNLADTKRIWSFGPDNSDGSCNVLVDTTKGTLYLNEIKDYVNRSFQWVALEGPLCNEPMRGVRLNLIDVTLQFDAIHRGGGQVIPTAKRAMYGAFLTAKPALMEPIYLVEIRTKDQTHLAKVRNVLAGRRARLFDSQGHYSYHYGHHHHYGHQQSLQSACFLKAYLPVVESFGLTSALRAASSGHGHDDHDDADNDSLAQCQCVFDHWRVLAGDPLAEGNPAYDAMLSVRKRKGLKTEAPLPDQFIDKL